MRALKHVSFGLFMTAMNIVCLIANVDHDEPWTPSPQWLIIIGNVIKYTVVATEKYLMYWWIERATYCLSLLSGNEEIMGAYFWYVVGTLTTLGWASISWVAFKVLPLAYRRLISEHRRVS